MTRNTAREIAAHLAYEWNFTDLPVGEFLDRRLAPECFAELAPECGRYADAPNAKHSISAVWWRAWRTMRRSWTTTSPVTHRAGASNASL